MITKTKDQIEFEKSSFVQGDVDLMRSQVNGKYIFSSGKDAFEMFLEEQTKDEFDSFKETMAKLFDEEQDRIAASHRTFGSVYLDSPSSTTLTSDGPPYETKCTILIELCPEETWFEIPVSEYRHTDAYRFVLETLNARGLNVYTDYNEWLKRS